MNADSFPCLCVSLQVKWYSGIPCSIFIFCTTVEAQNIYPAWSIGGWPNAKPPHFRILHHCRGAKYENNMGNLLAEMSVRLSRAWASDDGAVR